MNHPAFLDRLGANSFSLQNYFNKYRIHQLFSSNIGKYFWVTENICIDGKYFLKTGKYLLVVTGNIFKVPVWRSGRASARECCCEWAGRRRAPGAPRGCSASRSRCLRPPPGTCASPPRPRPRRSSRRTPRNSRSHFRPDSPWATLLANQIIDSAPICRDWHGMTSNPSPRPVLVTCIMS